MDKKDNTIQEQTDVLVDDHVEELKTTWKTLVTYRDIALSKNDFNRAVLYSNVIEDVATMIQSTGAQLPDLSEVRR